MDLSRLTAFITGISGFIGRALAHRLLHAGATVRGLSRSPESVSELAAAGAEIVAGDLLQPSAWADQLRGCDVVFHAAAEVSERSGRERLMAVNVEGTEAAIGAAKRAGSPRLVHLSSCAVYGSPQFLGVDEQFPLRLGASAYHDSKVLAEELVWRAVEQDEIAAVIARPSQVYGAASTNFTLRPLRVLRSGRLFLVDGGRHFCKPIYIDDLIDGLLACATSDRALAQAFNFSNDAPVTWRVFFGHYAAMLGGKQIRSLPYWAAWLLAASSELVAQASGRPPPIERRTLRTFVSTNSFSNRKARRVLGWRQRVSLEEGMRRIKHELRESGFLPQA